MKQPIFLLLCLSSCHIATAFRIQLSAPHGSVFSPVSRDRLQSATSRSSNRLLSQSCTMHDSNALSRRDFARLASTLPAALVLAPASKAQAQEKAQRPGTWAKRPKGTPFSEEELAGFTELSGGVQIKDITQGAGKVIGPKTGIKMNYAGYRLSDGAKFDNTWELGKQVGVRLGNKSVIPGLDIGLQGMNIGGRRIIIIPAELAYKDKSVYRGAIPPGSDLVIYVQPYEEEYVFGPLESVNAFKIGALPEEKPKQKIQVCYDPNGCPGN